MQLTIKIPSLDDMKHVLCDEDNIRAFQKGISDAYKASDTERKNIMLSTGDFFYGRNQECTSYFIGYILGFWENCDDNVRNIARYGHRNAFRNGLEKERQLMN